MSGVFLAPLLGASFLARLVRQDEAPVSDTAFRLVELDANLARRRETAARESARLLTLRTKLAEVEAKRPALLVARATADDTQAEVMLTTNAAEAGELRAAIADGEATLMALRQQFDGFVQERAGLVREQYVQDRNDACAQQDERAIAADRAAEAFIAVMRAWIVADLARFQAERTLNPSHSEVSLQGRLTQVLSHLVLGPIREALPHYPTSMELSVTQGRGRVDFGEATPPPRGEKE